LEQSARSGPRPKAHRRPCLSQRSFPSSDGRRLGHLHRTLGAAVQMTKPNAADSLSRKSVRTVRRSLTLDARELWRSCCYRRHKVRRSLFRKVSSSWSRPASYSRIHPIQSLRFRKLRGDTSLGGLAAVLLGLRRCRAIAPHSFATIEARRAPQSILQPRR